MADKRKDYPMKQLYEEFTSVASRQGRGGQTYDYIKSQDVVDRLNKVFGIRWSVQELETRFENDWVIKRVQIVVMDEDKTTWIREGEAGHRYMQNIDPPDVHKSAFSKALTKAASLLGIGLSLYGLEDDAIENGHDASGQQVQLQGNWGPVPQPQAQPQYAPQPQPQPQGQTFAQPPSFGQPQPQAQPQPMPQPQPVQYAPPLAPVPTVPPQPQAVNTGFTQGPGTAAQASVTMQVQPQPGPPNFSQPQAQSQPAPAPMPTGGTTAPTSFQLMAVKAAAAIQKKDPMQLAAEYLGQEVAHLQQVEQLTGEQAQKILAELRAIEVAGTFNS